MKIKRAAKMLECYGIFYSYPYVHEDTEIKEVTKDLVVGPKMDEKLVFITKDTIQNVKDWHGYVNVALDCTCVKEVKDVQIKNLLILGAFDMDKAYNIIKESLN